MTARRTTLADSKEVYRTVEFHRWVDRTDLNADERYLISTYLDPTQKTLEAGTGGGRILLAMKEMGFSSLSGFDFVPELVAEARRKDPSGAIDFQVQDATRLTYPDAAFEQLIYLQQVVCFIESESARFQAVREAFRVLRPGGVALFSVLSFEVRRRSPIYRVLMTYWRLLRWIRGSPLSTQAMPWMRLGGRFNAAALLDRGPYVHWFRTEEFLGRLQSAGFLIEAVGSSRQIADGRLCTGLEQLTDQALDGALYCVCKKPQAGSVDQSSGATEGRP